MYISIFWKPSLKVRIFWFNTSLPGHKCRCFWIAEEWSDLETDCILFLFPSLGGLGCSSACVHYKWAFFPNGAHIRIAREWCNVLHFGVNWTRRKLIISNVLINWCNNLGLVSMYLGCANDTNRVWKITTQLKPLWKTTWCALYMGGS